MSSAATVTRPRAREKSAEKFDDNLVSLYLKDINKVPLATREEEERLARAAAKGDAGARDKLVRANLRFVVNIAKRYQHRGLPLEDLISEGNIGLLHAIERFDVEKGYHFISYAVWWIRQAILNAINEKSRMIRLPLNRAAEIARFEAAAPGEKPTASVALLSAMAREPLSLDAPVSAEEESSPFGDTVEDRSRPSQDEQLVQGALRDDIKAVLGTLARKEAEIIQARFGLNGRKALSLRELGHRYRLTKERIRQIEKRALRQLQAPARARLLESYR
jgi:RNA polymerase primary sigma factor